MVIAGTKASKGPREGVAADRDPEEAAVRNVPLRGSEHVLSFENATPTQQSCHTHELVLREMTSSDPDNREMTHTWLMSVGSTTWVISFALSSLSPSGARGNDKGAA